MLRVLQAFDAEVVEYVLIGAAAMKKGTIRALDHQDAAMLRQAFNLKDDGR
jgi:hypothetical protein